MKLPVTKKNLIDSGFCFNYEADRVLDILNSDPEFQNIAEFYKSWDKAIKVSVIVNRMPVLYMDSIMIPINGVSLNYNDDWNWHLEIYRGVK